MDHQTLYELADRELHLGVADRALLHRARTEAGDIAAKTPQIYWRLRTEAWRADAGRRPDVSETQFVRGLADRLDRIERQRTLCANLVGWMWVLVCFAALSGMMVSLWAAKAAYNRGADPLHWGGLGVGCAVLAIVAYMVCRRDAGKDPCGD